MSCYGTAAKSLLSLSLVKVSIAPSANCEFLVLETGGGGSDAMSVCADTAPFSWRTNSYLYCLSTSSGTQARILSAAGMDYAFIESARHPICLARGGRLFLPFTGYETEPDDRPDNDYSHGQILTLDW